MHDYVNYEYIDFKRMMVILLLIVTASIALDTLSLSVSQIARRNESNDDVETDEGYEDAKISPSIVER